MFRLLPLLLLLASAAKAQDITVSFDIDSDPLFVGEEVVLNIIVDNGGDGLVQGGGVDLVFNPGVLQLSGVALNPSLDGPFSSTGTIDNDTGTVATIGFNVLFDAPGGEFPLAELTFDAVAPGLSDLTLTESVNPIYDWGTSGTASGSVVPDLTFVDSEVQVVVPLPAAGVMMLSGLLGLLAVRRRRAV